MTECERIIKESILPESFFKEEVRCDFLVTEKRKKIWAVELDLLMRFEEICREHDLKWWVDGGTLLGAIRHNGFIPWDDDIDVIMPRKDYNHFVSLASEFNHPYVLLTPHTNCYYNFSFAKIVNENTTCIPLALKNAGYQQGIGIDVFPLDYINLDTYITERDKIKEMILCCSSYMKRNAIEYLDAFQLERINQYNTDNPVVLYDTINDIASNPAYEGSPYVANAVFTGLTPEKQIWKAAWYEGTSYHQFETLNVPIPHMPVERLKGQYGNYMKLPEIVKRGVWHDDVIWDPDKSYMKYL